MAAINVIISCCYFILKKTLCSYGKRASPARWDPTLSSAGSRWNGMKIFRMNTNFTNHKFAFIKQLDMCVFVFSCLLMALHKLPKSSYLFLFQTVLSVQLNKRHGQQNNFFKVEDPANPLVAFVVWCLKASNKNFVPSCWCFMQSRTTTFNYFLFLEDRRDNNDSI